MIRKLARAGVVSLGIGALALAGGAAYAASSTPAVTSGGIITTTSNGEAGWYSNGNDNPFIETHSTIDLPVGIEATGANGGIGLQLAKFIGSGHVSIPVDQPDGTTPVLTPNGQPAASPIASSDVCYVTQVGLKEDGTGAYQAWTAVGELVADPNAGTDGNQFNGGTGNACTQGGSLAADPLATYSHPHVTYEDGYIQVTAVASEIIGAGAVPGSPTSAQNDDIQPGQAVFLKLEIGNNHNGLHLGVVKGTAQALDATVNPNGSYHYTALTPQVFNHIITPPSFGTYDGGSYVNAGTVFDNAERAVFPSGGGVEEARFDGLRAADGIHKVNGVWIDDYNVLGFYGQFGAESTSNGTPSGGIFVQPSDLPFSVFTVNVGGLVTAG